MAKKEQFQDALNARRLKKEAQLSKAQSNSERLLLEARRYVEEYESKVKSDLPGAREAISQVVLPWFEEVKRYLTDLEGDISIKAFEPSEYKYPHHAYESISEGFAHDDWSVRPGVWTSNFYIEKGRGEPRLITKRILKNGGLGFAWISKRYEIEISSEDVAGIHGVYPKTILELAEEIRSGRIWESLSKGI